MQLSLIRHRWANQEPTDGLARTEHVSPPWHNDSSIRARLAMPHCGPGERGHTPSNGQGELLVGLTTNHLQSPAVGCLLEIHSGCPISRLCGVLTRLAQSIWEWFVLQWQRDVTFHKARAPVNAETQRPWSDPVTWRTTPSHDLCSLVSQGSALACSSGSLVSQVASHFFRDTGFESPSVADHTFFPVACHSRQESYPAREERAASKAAS